MFDVVYVVPSCVAILIKLRGLIMKESDVYLSAFLTGKRLSEGKWNQLFQATYNYFPSYLCPLEAMQHSLREHSLSYQSTK